MSDSRRSFDTRFPHRVTPCVETVERTSVPTPRTSVPPSPAYPCVSGVRGDSSPVPSQVSSTRGPSPVVGGLFLLHLSLPRLHGLPYP